MVLSFEGISELVRNYYGIIFVFLYDIIVKW